MQNKLNNAKVLWVKRMEKAWPLMPILVHPKFLSLAVEQRWKFWKAVAVFVSIFCLATLLNKQYFWFSFVSLILVILVWVGAWRRYMNRHTET